MADEHMALPHRLVLNERRNLTMTGATEVVSFDELAVVVKTRSAERAFMPSIFGSSEVPHRSISLSVLQKSDTPAS